MLSSIARSASLFLLFTSALAETQLPFTPCPLLGPFYPPFKLDADDKTLGKFLQNLTVKFDDLMRTGTGENGPVKTNTTSFSIAVFSTNKGTAAEDPFFWQYQYSAPEYLKGPNKPRNVTKDSVYRIGGLTEVFTVWTLLASLGEGVLYDPVTKHLPELGNGSATSSIHQTQWDEITVGQLASHMSGLPRDYCSIDLTTDFEIPTDGFPDHSAFHRRCCTQNSRCSQREFIRQLSKLSPVANPGQTPVYSNVAFQLLGYIIERRTGHSFKDSVQHLILDHLDLNETSVFAPMDTNNAVIPISQKDSGWLNRFPGSEASTSMFFSLDNLARAGQAIMSSQLLSKAETNRWLKPVTHTSNPSNSLGYPFVIYSGGEYPKVSPMVDAYTVLSNEGYNESLYSSYMGLVPDWGVGYAILSADTESPADLNAHADYVTTALEGVIKTAITQAYESYGGSYASSGTGTGTGTGTGNSSSSSSSNSSLTIKHEEREGWGIYIEDFTSNGKDYRETLSEIFGFANETVLSMRLYPTRLSESGKAGQKLSFRAVFQDKTELADNGTPTCVSWMDLDKYRYNGHGLDEFVFELDVEGNVVGVEVPALEVTLEKQDEEKQKK